MDPYNRKETEIVPSTAQQTIHPAFSGSAPTDERAATWTALVQEAMVEANQDPEQAVIILSDMIRNDPHIRTQLAEWIFDQFGRSSVAWSDTVGQKR